MGALQKEVEEENEKHPEYKEANNYAFMCGDFPVTVGYALHALGKEQMKGSHPLSALLETYNKKEDWEKLMAAMKKAGLI